MMPRDLNINNLKVMWAREMVPELNNTLIQYEAEISLVLFFFFTTGRDRVPILMHYGIFSTLLNLHVFFELSLNSKF